MIPELLLAFITFAFVSSITPGPNNLMLMASGANFGIRRTVPHMLGISIGHAFMVFMVGVGLSRVFDSWPLSHSLLKVASVAYLSWLAWKIAHAGAPGTGTGTGTGTEASRPRPFTFLQAAAFQWVNPKAWTMALTAITVYTPGREPGAVLITALVFAATNLPSVSTWALVGREIRRILTSPGRLTAFNWTMAALLMASLYPVLTG